MFVILILIYLAYRITRLWLNRHQRTLSWWVGLLVIILGFAALGWLVHSDLMAAKIASLLFMPAGLVWMLLAGMLTYLWVVRRVVLASLLSLTFVIYTATGNAWLGSALLTHLENQMVPIDPALCAPFDAVCVLGGGTTLDVYDHPELSDSGDRVLVAAQLYFLHKTPQLVCSGTAMPEIEGQSYDFAQQTRFIWRSLGIPDSAIIALPPGPVNTTGEIEAYKTLIAHQGWHRVGLLSSAWHLPRALRLAARLGLSMVPIPADLRGRMPPWSAFWMIPQDQGFKTVHIACREILGICMGR